MESQTINCRNCGAPVTSEICPYCGSMTGLVTAHANMDYPVLECKEANIGFWNVVFPGIFFLVFGVIGSIVTIFVSRVSKEMTATVTNYTGERFTTTFSGAMMLPGIIPMIIGLIAFIIMMIPLIRYMMIKLKGKKISGTVYGYVDDNILINGVPAQTVKLLVQSPDGPRFIMYQLGKTDHPYGINTQIDLYVYNNYFMIDKSKEKIKW